MEREKQLQQRYAMLQDELAELENGESGTNYLEVNGEQ
jgi:hypothetical protein